MPHIYFILCYYYHSPFLILLLQIDLVKPMEAMKSKYYSLTVFAYKLYHNIYTSLYLVVCRYFRRCKSTENNFLCTILLMSSFLLIMDCLHTPLCNYMNWNCGQSFFIRIFYTFAASVKAKTTSVKVELKLKEEFKTSASDLYQVLTDENVSIEP